MVSPVCNSCSMPLTENADKMEYSCTNMDCQEFSLDQSINDEIQPLSKCGVPLYKHSKDCQLCASYYAEAKASAVHEVELTCNSCGSVRANKEDVHGEYSICEHPGCNSTDMRFYTDRKLPLQGLVCSYCGARSDHMNVCRTESCMNFGSAVNLTPHKSEQAVKGETGADTIKARESVYGPFDVHAKAEQAMKAAMTGQPGWELLNDVQKSAAEMIVHKLARILNGSADYDDNWHDISGYSTLAEQEIHKRLRK